MKNGERVGRAVTVTVTQERKTTPFDNNQPHGEEIVEDMFGQIKKNKFQNGEI